MIRIFSYVQVAVLGIGVVIAWSAVSAQVQSFIAMYGTLFRFRDCVMPNPLTAPCLYGALALLAAFAWSLALALRGGRAGQRRLGYLLGAGTVFASAVLAYEFLEYYHVFSFDRVQVSCSPGVHPLATPCFYGALAFFVALLMSLWLMRRPMALHTEHTEG